MPKWITVAFTLLLSFHVFSTQAKTVDEVIDNYISATAGKDALRMTKPVSKTSIRQPVRITAPFLFCPRNKVFTPFNKPAAQLFSPASAQESPASLHVGVAPGEPALVNYVAKGHKAVLAGKENRQGRECYKVLLTLLSGQRAEYYIDAASWQIIESRSVAP